MSKPIHTTASPELFSLKDGIVKTIFKHPDEDNQKSIHNVFRRPSKVTFSTTIQYSMMISPLLGEIYIPIEYLTPYGNTVYVSHINDHFILDMGPEMYAFDCDCWMDGLYSNTDDDDDGYTYRKRHKKKTKGKI